jgi:hypothetical protein
VTAPAIAGLVRDTCVILAAGAWCALAYHVGRMAQVVCPGLSRWTSRALWDPAVAFRRAGLTDAGLVCRARVRQALLTWAVAVAGAAALAALTASR